MYFFVPTLARSLFFTFFGKNWVEVVKCGKTACFHDGKIDNVFIRVKNTEKTLCAVKTHAIFSAQNFWAMFHVEHSKKIWAIMFHVEQCKKLPQQV